MSIPLLFTLVLLGSLEAAKSIGDFNIVVNAFVVGIFNLGSTTFDDHFGVEGFRGLRHCLVEL